MRALAVSNLFPSSLEPNRATFNRQHFEHLSQVVDLSMVVPLAWPGRFRGGRPTRVDDVNGPVQFATFYYPPRLLAAQHGKFCQWSIARQFRRLVREQKPQVIYATWVYPDGYAAGRLARELNLPLVIKAHGSDLHSVGASRVELTQRTLSMANRLITVCNKQRRLANDLGLADDSIATIYNGIDRDRFQPLDQDECRTKLSLPQRIPLLLFVGNLKPVKGLDFLLDGFAAMSDQTTQLAIVGGGALKQALQQQCERLGISSRVRFVGQVSHADIPLWMNAADAVVLTSVNEGVPNVLLEARAAGRPVVATAVGGIPEVVDHGHDGLLVQQRTAAELSERLDDVLNTSWSSQQLCERSKRFSWSKNATDTRDVLRTAIDSN